MRLTIDLVIECESEVMARSLGVALSPDNKSAPKDQSFSSSQEGRNLVFSISSPRASGCISSALSILSDSRLFQEVWSLAA